MWTHASYVHCLAIHLLLVQLGKVFGGKVKVFARLPTELELIQSHMAQKPMLRGELVFGGKVKVFARLPTVFTSWPSQTRSCSNGSLRVPLRGPSAGADQPKEVPVLLATGGRHPPSGGGASSRGTIHLTRHPPFLRSEPRCRPTGPAPRRTCYPSSRNALRPLLNDEELKHY